MASKKRQPITFEELEPKGRGAILRSAEEVTAEQVALESQISGIPEIQTARQPEIQTSGKPAGQKDGRSETAPSVNRATYAKATYRLSPDAMEAIDEVKRVLRRQYGIRVTLEEIAEEAILMSFQDLTENQQASILVNKFSDNPENQRSG